MLNHVDCGPSDAPAVILGGSLGSTYRQWDELVAHLSRRHRVVAVDHRGHGSSPAAESGVRVDHLADDVVALADHLGISDFAYVGISLGGAVGQLLSLDHADRVRRVVLACTAPTFGDPATWQQRAALVRERGVSVLREGTGERWFTDSVRPTARAQAVLDDLVSTDASSYAACCEAIAAFDTRHRLGGIDVPTLIVGADDDPVSPPAVIESLAAIPTSGTAIISDSRHLAQINQPQAFNAVVGEFLS